MTLWPFQPQLGIVEGLTWATDIIRTRSAEQRVCLRPTPRQDWLFNHVLEPWELALAKTLARQCGGDEFTVPIWQEMEAVGAVSPGATYVSCATAEQTYKPGAECVLWESYANCEVMTVDHIQESPSRVYFTAPVIGTFYNCIAMPGRTARFTQALRAQPGEIEHVTADVRFQTVFTEDGGGLVGLSYPTYRSSPVITDRPALLTELTEEFEREDEIIDTTTGDLDAVPVLTTPRRNAILTWRALSYSAKYALRLWILTRKGQQRDFWVPSWSSDATAASDIASTDTTITIGDVGLTSNAVGIADWMIVTTAGVRHYFRSTGSHSASLSREVLDLSAAFGTTLDKDDISIFTRLTRSRFASDRVEIRHVSRDEATVSMPITECPE
jgi:hypothetical protein